MHLLVFLTFCLIGITRAPADVMAECAKRVYRPRRPRETPFYRLVKDHFERFEQVYPERYEDRYGYLRPVIRETVCPGRPVGTTPRAGVPNR